MLLIIRLIIILRILPIRSIRPLIGILRISGIKLWILSNTPSCTTVIPFCMMYKLYTGWIRVKLSTKVVAANIRAYSLRL